jgi:uncharacterized membrane protein YdjX (TVP38/TMEM64 family)
MSDNTNQQVAPTASQTAPDELMATFKRLGPVGPLAIVACFPALGGFILLGFAPSAADWLTSWGANGPMVYAVSFALLAGLALLPTYAQAVVGGFAFGLTTGSVAAVLGFAGAATIGYVIARAASGDRVEDIIAEHQKLRAIHDELLRGGFWKTLGIVTLIRVPPNSPFAMTNLVLAATKIPSLVYVLGTVIGMAPRTIVAVYIGSTFSDLSDITTPLWLKITGIVVMVAVLLVIGVLANRAISHVTGMGSNTVSQAHGSEED